MLHWKHAPWTQPRTDHHAEPHNTANCRGSHAAELTGPKEPGLWLWVLFSIMLVVASSCSAFWEVCLDPCCSAGGCGGIWSPPKPAGAKQPLFSLAGQASLQPTAEGSNPPLPCHLFSSILYCCKPTHPGPSFPRLVGVKVRRQLVD